MERNEILNQVKREIEPQVLEGYFDQILINRVVDATLKVINYSQCCKSDSVRFDSKYTPPFRVGRKQGKAVLDATGREVIFFSDSEEQARKYCDYLNGC